MDMSNEIILEFFLLLSASQQYQTYLKLSWVIRNSVSGYYIVDDIHIF